MECRLTALLAVDVIGYTRLMGNDEAGTLAQLKEIQPAVSMPRSPSIAGRIVKLTDDGALAEIPSLVNAVSCATEIQTAIRVRTPEGAIQTHAHFDYLSCRAKSRHLLLIVSLREMMRDFSTSLGTTHQLC